MGQTLKDLLGVHFEMGPADRAICAGDEEIVYRLRKVLLHVKAIAGWQLDTEVMHVLAPEIRTADEQIDLVWKKLRERNCRSGAVTLTG